MIPDDTPAEAQSPRISPLLRGFARGVGWTYLSFLVTGVAVFFITAWTVRRVGTAQYGLFALVTSITGLMVICDYAIGLTVVRASARVDVASDPSHESGSLEVVHVAHGAYVCLGLAVLAVTLGVCAFIATAGSQRPYLLPTVALMGGATAIELGTAVFPALVQGCRRFAFRSAAITAGAVVRVAVALALVDRFGVAGLAGAQLFGIIAERLCLYGLVRRHLAWFVIRPRVPRRAALGEVASFAFPLLVLNVSSQLFTLSDLVVIGALVGTATVGVYQVATLLPVYSAALLVVGYNVVFPSLAGSQNPDDQETATAFLTRVFSYGGGTVLTLLALLRADAIGLLLGHESQLGETVLVIFCGICLANMVLHGQASLLIVRGHQAIMSRVVVIELPVNLVLTVVFVIIWGASGAGLATLVTVLLMNFVVFPIVSRGQFSQSAMLFTLRHGLVPAAAGASIAVAAAVVAQAVSTPEQRIALALVVGGVASVVAGLGLLGSSGRVTLREAFARQVGPVPAVPGAMPL